MCVCVCMQYLPYLTFILSFLPSLPLSVTLAKIRNGVFFGLFKKPIPGSVAVTDYCHCRRVRVAGGIYQRRKVPLISGFLWKKWEPVLSIGQLEFETLGHITDLEVAFCTLPSVTHLENFLADSALGTRCPGIM